MSLGKPWTLSRRISPITGACLADFPLWVGAHCKCHRCSGSLSICFRLNWPEAGTWTPALSSKAMHVALQSERGGAALARPFTSRIKPRCHHIKSRWQRPSATAPHTSGLLGNVACSIPEMTKSTFLFNSQLQTNAFP